MHPEWCGPCSDVLEGFYRKTALEVNSGDANGKAKGAGESGEEGASAAGPALQFLTVSRQLLGAKLRTLLVPAAPQKEGGPSQQQQHSAVATAGAGGKQHGASTAPPQFALDDGSGGGGAAAVAGLLESGGCQPLFVFVKGRQLVGVVRGVDTPAMLQQIQQHAGGGASGMMGPGAA